MAVQFQKNCYLSLFATEGALHSFIRGIASEQVVWHILHPIIFAPTLLYPPRVGG